MTQSGPFQPCPFCGSSRREALCPSRPACLCSPPWSPLSQASLNPSLRSFKDRHRQGKNIGMWNGSVPGTFHVTSSIPQNSIPAIFNLFLNLPPEQPERALQYLSLVSNAGTLGLMVAWELPSERYHSYIFTIKINI